MRNELKSIDNASFLAILDGIILELDVITVLNFHFSGFVTRDGAAFEWPIEF